MKIRVKTSHYRWCSGSSSDSKLQTSQHWPVRTDAGPKLLQERVFLRRVRRRQNLRSVVTSQLDAHKAKRLRRERRWEHTCTLDECCSYIMSILLRYVTKMYNCLVFLTYAGSVHDQECVSGRHASMCV